MKLLLQRCLLVLCFTVSPIHAEEKSVPADLLDQLQTVVAARKPYLSEYQLLGPRGELHATIGKGENRQFVLQVIFKESKEAIFEFWCADGKRIFMRSGGTTQCIQDAFSFTDALSQLNTIFSGEAPQPVAMETSLYMEEEALAAGLLMKLSPLLNSLNEDDSCAIKKNAEGKLEIASQTLGTLIIDPKDVSIIEQNNGPRSMKRIRHEKKNAAELVADLVKKIDPAPFEISSLVEAAPQLRSLASMAFQQELNAVDKGETTAKQLKEKLDKHASELAHKVMSGLLGGKEGVLRRKSIDNARDKSLGNLRDSLKKKGLPAADIENIANSDQSLKLLAEQLIRSLQKTIDGMGNNAPQKIIRYVLDSNLTATTEDGKKAQSDMTDAIIRAYIVFRVHDSVTRLQKSRGMD